MKTILTLVMVVFSLAATSQTKTEKLLAACCTKKEGRCTGSASCSACTNCSRCAHCSNGGSCGVCGGGSTQSFYKSKPRQAKKTTSRNSRVPTRKSYYDSSTTNDVTPVPDFEIQSLTTTTESVNLHGGPGTGFEILERVPESEIVMIIEQIGEWIQVQVQSTESVGYIFFKYLN